MLTLGLFVAALLLIVAMIPLGWLAFRYGTSAMASKRFFLLEKREGHIFAILKNKVFNRVVVAKKGYDILSCQAMVDDYNSENETTHELWDVVPVLVEVKENSSFAKRWRKNWIERRYDIAWLGLPGISIVYQYPFSWTSPRQESGGRVTGVKEHQDEMLDSILAQEKTYLFYINEAENLDRAQFNLLILMTWRCVNPKKALFGVQNWLETVISKLRAGGKNFVATKAYNDLIKTTGIGQSDEFQSFLKTPIEEILRDYGIEITNIDIAEIDPAGELSTKFVEASIFQYVADQEAEALKKKAAGESEADKTRAEGKAAAIKKVAEVITSCGEDGRLAASLKTLETAAEKGKLVVTTLPLDVAGVIGNTKKIMGR